MVLLLFASSRDLLAAVPLSTGKMIYVRILGPRTVPGHLTHNRQDCPKGYRLRLRGTPLANRDDSEHLEHTSLFENSVPRVSPQTSDNNRGGTAHTADKLD